MITNLIPSIDFGKAVQGMSYFQYKEVRTKYDAFLQQKPTLSMFIACVDGVPVSEPSDTPDEDIDTIFEKMDVIIYKKYRQAKDNVLFSGFKILKKYDNAVRLIFPSFEMTFWDSEKHPRIGTTDIITLEDLTRYNLPLTPKAQQIIYGTK